MRIVLGQPERVYMQTLLVLKKKFGNDIAGKVSEYLSGNRKIWLAKYRYVINNGICNRGEKYLNSPKISEQRGVKTFRLLSTMSNKWGQRIIRKPGLHFYMNESKDRTNFFELQRTRRRFYHCWQIRCRIARERCRGSRDNKYDNWGIIF